MFIKFHHHNFLELKTKVTEMNIHRILKVTRNKITLSLILMLFLPNYAYWSCCLHPPCEAEYVIHYGFFAFLIQLHVLVPQCGKLTYFYFWPLSFLISYLIVGILMELRKVLRF